jgi:hypothetical protein
MQQSLFQKSSYIGLSAGIMFAIAVLDSKKSFFFLDSDWCIFRTWLIILVFCLRYYICIIRKNTRTSRVHFWDFNIRILLQRTNLQKRNIWHTPHSPWNHPHPFCIKPQKYSNLFSTARSRTKKRDINTHAHDHYMYTK